MSAPQDKLWVVMPVYNEEASLAQVVADWTDVLAAWEAAFEYTLLLVNDGSTDDSLSVIQACQQKNSRVVLMNQTNAGHGQACLAGYREAVHCGADWVLQIDSDGQCDPVYFALLWEKTSQYPLVFGYRSDRQDGWLRFAISRCVTWVLFALSGVWVRDANVPYRLMRADYLQAAIEQASGSVDLWNIVLAYELTRCFPGQLCYVPIQFLKRRGGEPKLNLRGILRKGAMFACEFLQYQTKRKKEERKN